ncbi:MAG: sterol desaturase family protein [Acidobacteriaceae bacterium]|nr:sterol desaturase family protein [Acidobacteriaceae bacterium]
MMAAFNSAFTLLPGLAAPSPFAALHLSGFWQWSAGALVYAILWDRLQYWFQRLQHGVPFFRRTHALHHDSEAFHCSDALRNTVGASLTQILLIGYPLVAIGAHQLLHLTAGVRLFSIFGFYNHANIRLGHGVLAPLLTGPQFQRVHHGCGETYQNANFATFFPWIDMLFGTYRRPCPDDFPPTGVAGRRQSQGARSLLSAFFGC